MRPSHPKTLLKIAQATLTEGRLVLPGDVILVALSGGPDSMALVHVLSILAPRLGIRVVAHGVDHGLRPAARGELELAATWASRIGVPFSTTRVAVAPGANLMARAREQRYQALRSALSAESTPAPGGRRFIATGHHADDRAETVLIRLLRGTGPEGLAVLPARAGDLIRPLLHARRSDVLAHVQRHDIPHAHDPSNADPRFLRSRVRSELLPLMADLSPRIVFHLAHLAEVASQARPELALDTSTELAAGDPHPQSLAADADGIVGARAQGGGAHAGAAARATEIDEIPSVLEGHRLGKAQRLALGRALKNRNPKARVPLRGGEIAGVDLSSRRIVLIRDK